MQVFLECFQEENVYIFIVFTGLSIKISIRKIESVIILIIIYRYLNLDELISVSTFCHPFNPSKLF